jgi:dihydrolipoamide dehydrogenase
VPDTFDLVVLGGGTGGYAAAIRGATLGLSVALVERDKVGGTCLHRGCIPAKALLHSAEVVDTIREAPKVGIGAGEPTVNWPAVQTYKDAVVDKMFKGLTGLIKHRKIELISGTGAMRSPTAVAVGGRELSARNIVVATGSAPKLIPGLEIGERVITSDEAMNAAVPRPAIVLGAGSVGVEFASIWASLGSKVTVVEMLPTLVPLEDPDLGRELAKQFGKRGIRALTGAKLEDAKVGADSVRATVTVDGKTEEIEADLILVAVGRRPVTENAGLANAGVEIDERGFVKVRERYETTASGVFAVGDCIDTPGLAHVAFGEGMCVAEQLASRGGAPVNYDAVPRVTYCAPEVAAVGLTEPQARERGFDVVTKTVNLVGIGKAVITGTQGFCKLVAERDGRLLGAHYIGAHVTELVAEAMLAIGWVAMPEEIAALFHPHPSLSEMFGEAALALSGRALHTV